VTLESKQKLEDFNWPGILGVALRGHPQNHQRQSRDDPRRTSDFRVPVLPALEPVSFLLACFKMDMPMHVCIYRKMELAKARIAMSKHIRQPCSEKETPANSITLRATAAFLQPDIMSL